MKPKKPFSNSTIQERQHGKPHICKREGWWRVSSWKRGTGDLYYKAHAFVDTLNVKEHLQCLRTGSTDTESNDGK